MTSVAGKYLIVIGIVAIVAGLLLTAFPNLWKWFGHLPLDIRIERENFSFYAPIGSMLVISVVLSLAVWLMRRFWE
jgi:hypothetical protein